MNCFKVLARAMSATAKQWEPLSRVGVIGVPLEKGQTKYGVSVAPAALRSAGLLEELRGIDGLEVKDYGDIEIPSSYDGSEESVANMHYLPLISASNKKLSKKVSEVLRDDRVVVTIGGDHSIGVGTVDGHYSVNEDMILIWVDAHADINTNKTSGSGSVHGMPVALLAKELSDYWPYLPTMDWQVPRFSIKNLGYVGLRSVDKYERLAIEKYNVVAFAMEDIEKHGIQNSIEHVLNSLDPCMNKPIHVSFDIDSLDALEAPSTGTPVRGGLNLREGIKLMEMIHATGRLRAIDLVEINPAIGNDKDRRQTIEAGLAILKAGLGFSRRGTAPRGVLDLPVQMHDDHDCPAKQLQANTNSGFLAINFLTLSNALEAKKESSENDMKEILGDYLNKIPDIESKFVINEKLADAITDVLGGKISALPLYKMSLQIDRDPVKIPWSLDAVLKEEQSQEAPTIVKKYKHEKAS